MQFIPLFALLAVIAGSFAVASAREGFAAMTAAWAVTASGCIAAIAAQLAGF